MSAIDFNIPFPSPKVEQDINFEQNLPLTIGYDCKKKNLDAKNQQFQKFSNTAPSAIQMQTENQQGNEFIIH